MFLRKWSQLPAYMKTAEVRPYYKKLRALEKSLMAKRGIDIFLSSLLLLCLSPVMLLVGVLIKLDSPGPVFFRQERITQYGRKFKIFKFRTMVNNAQRLGGQVTVGGDARITRMGKKIRKYRIDEIPQLINVLTGDMTFVGTRPEVEKYVRHYSREMFATLLLPAGITSEASIEYKDEESLLAGAEDADKTYIEQVLPGKMAYNLKSLENYSILSDLKTMLKTVIAVIR